MKLTSSEKHETQILFSCNERKPNGPKCQVKTKPVELTHESVRSSKIIVIIFRRSVQTRNLNKNSYVFEYSIEFRCTFISALYQQPECKYSQEENEPLIEVH